MSAADSDTAVADASPPPQSLPDAIEHHPHARAILTSALAAGLPSHAYLFHGPPGVGKRAAARAFAVELLAPEGGDPGTDDPSSARSRAFRGVHPDLTWVTPSGAHEMRVSDIEQPVVRAAGRTPFESERRVFVIEAADTMSSDVANRMLKALEEPPEFVHFILLTDFAERVLPTVYSRCQPVRFDRVPTERIADLLVADGCDIEEARGCAGLAGGSVDLARALASAEGRELRTEAGRVVASAVRGVSALKRPWAALIERANAAGEAAEAAAIARAAERAEQIPEGRGRQGGATRERDELARRESRRARTDVLARALRLASLLLRDLAVASAGAGDAVLAVDRADVIARVSAGSRPATFIAAAELIEDVRASMRLNVAEQLALEAMCFRLDALLSPR